MIFLIIFGAIILILLCLLLIPFAVTLEYDNDIKIFISFLGIKIFKSKSTKKIKEKTDSGNCANDKSKKSVVSDTKNYFKGIKEKKGFVTAVKCVMEFIGSLLSELKGFLRHIKICGVKLDITVGSDDAAKTAVDYGVVCQAVYPVTAFLDSQVEIGFREINVKADFDGKKCKFGFKGTFRIQIVYLLICAFKIYRTLKKFINGENSNE